MPQKKELQMARTPVDSLTNLIRLAQIGGTAFAGLVAAGAVYWLNEAQKLTKIDPLMSSIDKSNAEFLAVAAGGALLVVGLVTAFDLLTHPRQRHQTRH